MDEPVDFRLCRFCKERQGSEGRAIALAEDDSGCYICRGASGELEGISEKMLSQLKRYDFRTFSVGLVLPSGMQEREDTLRSVMKIRGRETVKSELSNRLGREVVKRAPGKKVDRLHPDLTALVDMNEESISVSVTSKPLFLYGKYTKPRGVAQRRLFCKDCNGRGCESCAGTGYSTSPSVEGLVSKKLGELLGSKRFKFTWFGSEDTDSMVFPPGRPFVIESKSPRSRHPPKALRLRSGKGGLVVSGLHVVTKKFEHPSFTFVTRVVVVAERKISAQDVRKLQKDMRNALVQYRNNKGRLVDKRIYFVKASARGKKMTAEIKLDGGLPVKRLVSGEAVSPSFSESMGMPLRCDRFDILRVWPRPGVEQPA